MACHEIRQVIYQHQRQTMPTTTFQSPRASTPLRDFSGSYGVTTWSIPYRCFAVTFQK